MNNKILRSSLFRKTQCKKFITVFCKFSQRKPYQFVELFLMRMKPVSVIMETKLPEKITCTRLKSLKHSLLLLSHIFR